MFEDFHAVEEIFMPRRIRSQHAEEKRESEFVNAEDIFESFNSLGDVFCLGGGFAAS